MPLEKGMAKFDLCKINHDRIGGGIIQKRKKYFRKTKKKLLTHYILEIGTKDKYFFRLDRIHNTS